MKFDKTTMIVLAGVAVAAFALGALLLGGDGGQGDRTAAERAGHDHAAAPAQEQMWTCSMHPQIKLPREGKCPICYMDLIPLDTDAGDELEPRQLKMSEAARQLARIETTPAVRAFAEAEIRMVGRIAPDESKVAAITAWVPGRIDRLYADFTGITVGKGEHMALLYSPELLAAQEELVQAGAAVEALGRTTSSVLRSTAEATLQAAREKLRLYGLSADQIETIETTGKTSDRLTIHAPIGGVVIQKNVKEGMYVSTGTRIYTIAELSKLWVMFDAYESDLPWLRFGQRVEFNSPSFPGETFDAVISFIDPVVDPRTRTVRVRAIVENKDGRLKPDMFVRGVVASRLDGRGNVIDEYLADKWISPMHPEIVKDGPGTCDVCGMDLVPAASLGFTGEAAADEDAPVLIPATAPLITGTRAVVYVEIDAADSPVFEGREIELGPRAGDFYIVQSGIEEGERVVTNGAFKIDSELQIQARPSMMSPAATSEPLPRAREADAGAGRMEESSEAASAFTPVYDAYFDVQMALAKDDLAAARKAGGVLAAELERQKGAGLSRAGHEKWRSLRGPLVESAGIIAKADDIAAARDAFFHLSDNLIELHANFGHTGTGSFYLTFCPMAREGGGAFWLQTVDVVWNSFYGAEMLRCGTIEKELPSRSYDT